MREINGQGVLEARIFEAEELLGEDSGKKAQARR